MNKEELREKFEDFLTRWKKKSGYLTEENLMEELLNVGEILLKNEGEEALDNEIALEYHPENHTVSIETLPSRNFPQGDDESVFLCDYSVVESACKELGKMEGIVLDENPAPYDFVILLP